MSTSRGTSALAAGHTAGDAALVRVAIVDDHELVREALRSMVERCAGFVVAVEAENGEDYEAQCAIHGAPDIALVDLHMPVRDGWMTLCWMREHQPGTKGIALSFDMNEEAAWRAVEYGAVALLAKNERSPAWETALKAVRDEGDHLNARMRSALRYRPAKDSPVALRERMLAALTRCELRFLLAYVAEDEPTLKDLAARWGVEPSSVETWRRRVVEKLGVSSRLALYRTAVRFHLLN